MKTQLDFEIYVTINAHEDWQIQKEFANDKLYLLHAVYKKFKKDLYHFPTFEKWYEAIRKITEPNKTTDGSYRFTHRLDRYAQVLWHIQNLWKKPQKQKRYLHYWYYRHTNKSRWSRAFEPSLEKRKEAKERREHKRLWREKIGKKRDLQKSRWPRSAPKVYKRLRATQHRAFVARTLLKKNYDAFWQGEYESFVDRWSWD